MIYSRYCSICGKEKQKIQSGYDPNTVKELYIYTDCDIKDCKHGYHSYKFIYGKCRNCGERPYAGEGM